MQHAPAAYRDFLKVVPLAHRESTQTLRAHVREWTVAQRSYDDLRRHMAPDTSSTMYIGQVKGTKGKVKRARKETARRTAKARKTMVNRQDMRGQTVLFFFAGECELLWQVRKSSAGSRKQTKRANFQLQQFKQL